MSAPDDGTPSHGRSGWTSPTGLSAIATAVAAIAAVVALLVTHSGGDKVSSPIPPSASTTTGLTSATSSAPPSSGSQTNLDVDLSTWASSANAVCDAARPTANELSSKLTTLDSVTEDGYTDEQIAQFTDILYQDSRWMSTLAIDLNGLHTPASISADVKSDVALLNQAADDYYQGSEDVKSRNSPGADAVRARTYTGRSGTRMASSVL
jgi:hypothetical protein